MIQVNWRTNWHPNIQLFLKRYILKEINLVLALDPLGLHFESDPCSDYSYCAIHLDRSDAAHVEVIHTNGESLYYFPSILKYITLQLVFILFYT